MLFLRYLVTISCLLAFTNGSQASEKLHLATTTSTVGSGLLEVLIPRFEADSGLRVEITAVGTGKALRLGREGRVDVVLVHAPAAERKFVGDGHGVEHRPVMHNDFVLIGRADDPAGLRDAGDIVAVFQRLAELESPFVSRGDDSGTHKKELSLWRDAGIEPFGLWYREIGGSMMRTLEEANRLQAYVLIDRGTWLAQRKTSSLKIVTQGDERLFNPYGIIAVNPAVHPDVNFDGAMKLINWITDSVGQKLIDGYRIDGEKLYTATASETQ